MKPTDQLVILEAIALGYALAGKEQQAKIFAMLPASECVGPLGDVAKSLHMAAMLPLGFVGCVPSSNPMKAIIDELIVAETDRRRQRVAEEVAKLAQRMSDPRLPGGAVTETEINKIMAKARGLYGNEKASKEKQAGAGGSPQTSRELGKAAGKAIGGHQVASVASPKV